MENRRLVLLAGPGESTPIVYNALRSRFDVARVILEQPVSRLELLRRRRRRHGLAKVAGQLLFRGIAVPILRLSARERARQIKRQFGLDDTPIAAERVLAVPSANSRETIAALRELAPAVVVVNGTRILSRELLASLSVPFVNVHAGITPLYRGVHGGYWALAEGDRDRCGVTVHLVDEGVDTGRVLRQACIEPGPEDSFVTYPLLQLAAGLPLLEQAVGDLLAGTGDRGSAASAPSRLWTHPTLWEYVRNRWRGVR
jgi:folate-dependent phosphoribosylglycinamide formyltransferase PurN